MKTASASPILDRKKIDQVHTKEELGKVDVVVQEYMDNLLGDLFPEADTLESQESSENIISSSPEAMHKSVEPAESVIDIEKPVVTDPISPLPMAGTQLDPKVLQQELQVAVTDSETELSVPVISKAVPTEKELLPEPKERTYAKVIPHVTMPDENILPPVNNTAAIKEVKAVIPKPSVSSSIKIIKPIEPEILKPDVTFPVVNIPLPPKDTLKPTVKIETEKAVEKRFPTAPDWAQESFDVLLFDVCGLKLAVPMESLGRIIKVEHETNQLIGRPSWFMGAYNEADEHLYVVDTAKYIMPEKGYDLERDGFEYLIQMQKSKWTLACKNVHTTVRLEPDQVKWRSSQGKRQWLSGTVIEHMCALIHVDNLVKLLVADS